MADIAFLLLIFFISTTVFSAEEGLTLILPPRGGPKKQVNRKDVLVLSTDAQSRVYADDTPVADIGTLSDIVRARLRGNDKLIVSIETHPDARYQTMIRVLDEVKEAEAPRISIKTAAGGGP
jgi:biopolymer transport protein ExbD